MPDSMLITTVRFTRSFTNDQTDEDLVGVVDEVI